MPQDRGFVLEIFVLKLYIPLKNKEDTVNQIYP